jgi:hypothetical protein
VVPAERARVALACGIAAISGGWKMYISLPDDPTSSVLEIVGLSRDVDRPGAADATPGGLVLHVEITPTPKTTLLSYSVRVTDSSLTPVEQATVRLVNYTATGAPDIETRSTDAAGVANFADVALRSKTTIRRLGEDERITTLTSPKLTVSKDGFDTVNLNLL